MAKEYIIRDVALAFPFANGQYDRENADPHFINGCESYREWLEAIPAADVVDVVRCCECVYHDDESQYHYCRKWRRNCPNDSDFFCKWGKRKHGGQDE